MLAFQNRALIFLRVHFFCDFTFFYRPFEPFEYEREKLYITSVVNFYLFENSKPIEKNVIFLIKHIFNQFKMACHCLKIEVFSHV